MKILVIGSGGREHALAWKLGTDPGVEAVYAAPGSDGMCPPARRVDLAADDLAGLARFARDERIDLTVGGPEAPLVAGLVDYFQLDGLAAVGPTAMAAQLEGSKVFAKDFMARQGIPTARYETHDRLASAVASLEAGNFAFPVVIKADGLAAGKGVTIARDLDQCLQALSGLMEFQTLGSAGARVVIEEFLTGEEASFMIFADGEHALPLVVAQDHKALFDGDTGPNTGGMGAYSDDRILTPDQVAEIMAQVVEPTLRGMSAEGHPFRGILYFGLMLTDAGPRLLEYNVRLGDPETQPILLRLRSSLTDIFRAMLAGRLHEVQPDWDPRPAACVVLASRGYPGPCEKGKLIQGLELAREVAGVTIFHAGTRREGDRWLTQGGRVLGVTARGRDLQEAIMRVYEGVNLIRFDGMHYRRDIGVKGLKRYR